MRHGRVESPTTASDLATIKLRDDTDPSARAELTQIGEALAEVLHGQPDPVDRFLVIHEPTDHARLTAEALAFAYNVARGLRWGRAPKAVILDRHIPGPSPYADSRKIEDWIDEWMSAIGEASEKDDRDRTFLLQIGHDPRMSMLAREVVRDRSGDRWFWGLQWLVARFQPPIPALNHTEMLVCTRDANGRYRAHWTLGPTDDRSDAALRDKVKSKMDTAKVFAGVLTAVTAFAADNVRLDDTVDRALSLAGLALFGLSIVLYLITMFFYDALLMPRRFWQPAFARPSNKNSTRTSKSRLDDRLIRPPSSGTVVLFQNMVLIWSRIFVPATFIAGLGLVLFAAGAAELPSALSRIGFGMGALALAAIAIGIGRWGRPRLGTQD